MKAVRSALFGSVSAVLGCLLLLVSVGTALIGPLLAPASPTALFRPRMPPSSQHLLGTDQLGRDVLSRVLHGGIEVVIVPLAAVAIAFALGAAIGMAAGYSGGRTDAAVTRVVDVLISLPPLLLAIVFIAALGASDVVLIGVTAAFFMPRIVRIVRGATASVAGSDFVAAARVRGEHGAEIVWREVRPMIAAVLVVEFAARLGNVIMFVATLNFLGLGAQPPAANWGLMVNETKLLLQSNPLAPLVPALLIAALAVSISLLSDRLAAHLERDVAGASLP